MSKEGGKFTPGPRPKFPKLVLVAAASPTEQGNWDFTPPADGETYCIHFHARHDTDGNLYVSMFPDTMQPIR